MVFDPSNSQNKENKQKRIFILTEGDISVADQEEVTRLTEKEEEICLHSFIIGNSCNKKIV